MKTKTSILAGFSLLFIISIRSHAQVLRTFNQNSSRTNHYTNDINSGFSLSFSPLFSSSLNKSSDSLLFRGNGGGFRIDGDYFFGKTGIGFSSGFGSSGLDQNLINQFMQRNNIYPGEVTVIKSNQQNMYLLLGPSVRFGDKVELLLHAKGGLFINNGGLMMIQQKGAVRPMYMNGSTGKSIYPGFQTGINIQYSTKSDVWSFGIGADYMGTQTQINNYDVRRNGGIEPLKLSRNVSDMVAGISVRYNIAARKKHLGNIKYQDFKTYRKNGSIQAGDFKYRMNEGGNNTDIATDESGTVRTIDQSSCGPVTLKTTNPDGSVSETTFTCPDDAAQYSRQLNSMPSRLSMTPTAARQTQGKTFGEKVAQGLQRNGLIHRDLAARNILIGRVSRISGNIGGIETNKSILTKPGGAVSSSYAAGRLSNVNTSGISSNIYVRETGSGMATGRRQYQLVYSNDGSSVCSDCAASVVANPLYHSEGKSGDNALYQGKDKRIAGKDSDHDGLGDITVTLVDVSTGATLATTKTEANGEFFFANLPSNAYAVKISGTVFSNEGYDITLNKKMDISGSLLSADDNWQIELNTGTGTAEQAAALIKSKTKSNQSNDRTINSPQDNSGIIWSPRSNFKVIPISVAEGTWVQKVKTKSNQPNDRTVPSTIDGRKINWNADLDAETDQPEFETNDGSRVSEGGAGILPPHYPPVKGIPLKGVGVSLGKAPGGGCAARIQTNENGEFEITNLEAGSYWLIAQQTLVIDDVTELWVGDDSVSNTSENRKGWDGSVKGGSRVNMIIQFSVGPDGNLTGKLALQDNNAAQPNKSYMVIRDDGTFAGRLEAQDFNTCRSNRERGQLKTNSDADNNGGTNIMDQFQFSVKPDGSVSGKQVLQNASTASGKSLLNILSDGTISGILYAQDFNTCRSNRDNRLAARPGQPTTDGSEIQNQDINKSKSNVKNNFNADSSIEQPTTDAPTTGTYNNKPGQPIGGIIVKGGRNPGGQMMTLTTNKNGEFSLDAKEAGTYSFEIYNPPTNQKGIREAGIKRTEAVALRVKSGGKGIVTGTGGNARTELKTRHETAKNSISNVRFATNAGDDTMVVEDGRFSLEITEPGHYVLQVTSIKPAGKGIQEAGIK
ncbi:MAG: hypothetical protein JST17_06280 [Bacteroidetes bacterium]|nr:hypothetical protein [Bacteroidota bacterium]MBS1929834.1 hypothetical protein [Bacteroidota bacterium]